MRGEIWLCISFRPKPSQKKGSITAMIHAALGGRCLVAGVLFSPPPAEEGMQIQCKSPFLDLAAPSALAFLLLVLCLMVIKSGI